MKKIHIGDCFFIKGDPFIEINIVSKFQKGNPFYTNTFVLKLFAITLPNAIGQFYTQLDNEKANPPD